MMGYPKYCLILSINDKYNHVDLGDTVKPGSVYHWLESVATEKGAKTAISFLRSGRVEIRGRTSRSNRFDAIK